MTSTSTWKAFKKSLGTISSLFRQTSAEKYVYRKNNIFTEQKSASPHHQMAAYSTQQNQTQRNFLIVGLGNHDMPKTRHSIGMQVVNRMVNQLGVEWTRDIKTCGGFVAVCDVNEQHKIILLKPKVAMNLNGRSVQKTAKHYGIIPDDVYLIHDELDKSVGKFGFKYGGSARGHNGVRSVMQSLRSEDMTRMLIGIDRPANKDMMVQYVLSNFPSDEQQTINTVIGDCIQALAQHIKKKHGVDILQVNKENTKSMVER